MLFTSWLIIFWTWSSYVKNVSTKEDTTSPPTYYNFSVNGKHNGRDRVTSSEQCQINYFDFPQNFMEEKSAYAILILNPSAIRYASKSISTTNPLPQYLLSARVVTVQNKSSGDGWFETTVFGSVHKSGKYCNFTLDKSNSYFGWNYMLEWYYDTKLAVLNPGHDDNEQRLVIAATQGTSRIPTSNGYVCAQLQYTVLSNLNTMHKSSWKPSLTIYHDLEKYHWSREFSSHSHFGRKYEMWDLIGFMCTQRQSSLPQLPNVSIPEFYQFDRYSGKNTFTNYFLNVTVKGGYNVATSNTTQGDKPKPKPKSNPKAANIKGKVKSSAKPAHVKGNKGKQKKPNKRQLNARENTRRRLLGEWDPITYNTKSKMQNDYFRGKLVEKNWSPFIGVSKELLWSYKLYPAHIICENDVDLTKEYVDCVLCNRKFSSINIDVNKNIDELLMGAIHQSYPKAQASHFDIHMNGVPAYKISDKMNNTFYVGIAHAIAKVPLPTKTFAENKNKFYMHFFYKIDPLPPYSVMGISCAIPLDTELSKAPWFGLWSVYDYNTVAFVNGFEYDEQNNNFIISYGVGDYKSKILLMSFESALLLFQDVSKDCLSQGFF